MAGVQNLSDQFHFMYANAYSCRSICERRKSKRNKTKHGYIVQFVCAVWVLFFYSLLSLEFIIFFDFSDCCWLCFFFFLFFFFWYAILVVAAAAAACALCFTLLKTIVYKVSIYVCIYIAKLFVHLFHSIFIKFLEKATEHREKKPMILVKFLKSVCLLG